MSQNSCPGKENLGRFMSLSVFLVHTEFNENSAGFSNIYIHLSAKLLSTSKGYTMNYTS